MNTEQFKKTLVAMLISLEVRKIIIIDDKYSKDIDVDNLIQGLIESPNRKKLLAHYEIPDKDEVWQSKIKMLSDTERGALAANLIDVDGDKGIFDQISEDFKIDTYSLTAWREQKNEIIQRVEPKKTLFVFDRNFFLEHGSHDDGVLEIEALQKQLPSCICALYTHTIAPGNEYNEWQRILSEYEINKQTFIPISKQYSAEAPERLLSSFRLCLLNRRCAMIKEHVLSLAKESWNEARSEIDKIDIFDFEHIIFRLSHNEGTFEISTLLRLYETAHKRKFFSEWWKQGCHHNYITEIRTLPPEIPLLKNELGVEIFHLQNSELYDKDINLHHAPLELGDIFAKDGGDNKYMLLFQPCDLMVRGESGARSYAPARVPLVEIRPIPPLREETAKVSLASEEPRYVKLPYYHLSEEWVVDLKKIFYVDIAYLDLCVFNKEGKCSTSLPMPNTCASGLLPAWQKRYGKMKDELKGLIQYLQGINFKEKKKDADTVLRLLSSKPITFSCSFNPKDGIPTELKTGLARSERLKREYAEDVLKKFTNIMDRKATGMDMGRPYPHPDC